MQVNLVSNESLKPSESKEFLERQQNIDLLVALAQIGSVVPANDKNGLEAKILDKIRNTLDKL